MPANSPYNNPIIHHKYTADPTVIEYNGTVYLYTGHDEAEKDSLEYSMNEWLCFSSNDLKNRLYYNEDGTMKRVIMTSEGIQ